MKIAASAPQSFAQRRNVTRDRFIADSIEVCFVVLLCCPLLNISVFLFFVTITLTFIICCSCLIDLNIQNYDFSYLLYGCDTWSLTLREENGLTVTENRVLRRIFGSERE